jgi:hypothetical protein
MSEGSWLVQYKASSGAEMTTRHDTRREAFEVLADSLFSSALMLWDLGDERMQQSGDMLVRHALRLCAESEEESGEGYLLRLSKGRRWVVAPV